MEIEQKNSTGRLKPYKWWIRIATYTIFVLAGQSVATLLGSVYYANGGNSKWLATLVQLAGFPILLPYYLFSPLKKATTTDLTTRQPSVLVLILVYVSLGLLVAGNCYLYSVGLQYLPVSTYSLICATQLAFNALFSYFLNAQKFTILITNSLVLLTISSTLLVFQPESDSVSRVSRGKYVIGFVCTVGASAGYALILSLIQLSFQKVLKKETFLVVMDLIIYESLVASCAISVGLFISGEWKTLKGEMETYKAGEVSYVMNLVWTAIVWQLYSIGAVGIIFEVSSLFSNAISAMGLPIVPVVAVIVLGDKMDGIKGIAMTLAIWGFVSYVYQHYLDDKKLKAANRIVDEVP